MDKQKKKDFIVLIILILVLVIINYNFLDTSLQNFLIDYETVEIERIIDGDTLVASGQTIRLLGINTPERGEQHYTEAKQFLEELASNKTARLEFGKDKRDRYNRTLAYVIISGQNINLEIVKQGFANIYFPSGKDQYYNQFLQAWENCENNLCEKSSNNCAACIELKEFNVKNQKIVFYNKCEFNCDLTSWTVKDEGRKKFEFGAFILDSGSEVSISVKEGHDFTWDEDYVWTSTGDSLFLRDQNNGLVLWESY